MSTVPRETPSESSARARIDTVLFDFGNVLVTWDPYAAYAGRMARADVEAFFEAVDFPTFNARQDAGRSWADARRELAEHHPEHVSMLDVYTDNFAASLVGPVPGTQEIVRELRTLGVRLYGLTNWSAEMFHEAEPAAPAIGLMEDVLVSGRVGLVKPDPRIFEAATERFALDPARTLFVDDSVANVTAARALGFRTLHFEDAAGLRATLRDLGVGVREA
ncbi:HAD family hydrolase [Oerskovia rustica]|uniref:HAD family phosphatase n=1 Tax=Oerskovia rustica TaxID=2762237 RepID=A0ABR8RXJ8_9CELL|nr:HAD family phosphatase [Oerskovia rustica]MBD7952484.1 HAD family phosphatase [Oerskovia rustica]